MENRHTEIREVIIQTYQKNGISTKNKSKKEIKSEQTSQNKKSEKKTQSIKEVSPIRCGMLHELLWICGPCVIESEELVMEVAQKLCECREKYGLQLIFKASFDKANRSSIHSFRGPGLDKGLKILEKVKKEFGLLVTTDVHECHQVKAIAEVCEIIQIPAFLARQTDLLIEAGKTKCVVNVKKGQFMAPWDMKNVVSKLREVGQKRIMLTERGSTFGYGNLVNDMRSIPWMQDFHCPVIFDATHSVQTPGSQGTSTGGDRRMVPYLARAATAAGCDGIFLESHPNPDQAKSDGPNMLPLSQLATLFRQCSELRELYNSWQSASEKNSDNLSNKL